MLKNLIFILILIFNLQSWTKAEGLEDLNIEEFQIGESLLNYFSKEEIIKNTSKTVFKDTDKKFQAFFTDHPVKLKSYDTYQYVRVTYLNNNEFLIYGISGMRDYEKDDMQKCYLLQKKIEEEFDNLFSNFKKNKEVFSSRMDSTGKSKITGIYYYTENGYAEIACYDFAEHIKIASGIDVSITSNSLKDWLNSLAKN
jgi:hypothetical protein